MSRTISAPGTLRRFNAGRDFAGISLRQSRPDRSRDLWAYGRPEFADLAHDRRGLGSRIRCTVFVHEAAVSVGAHHVDIRAGCKVAPVESLAPQGHFRCLVGRFNRWGNDRH